MSAQDINTVILVMFENRSFDHMLGHLSFEGIKPDAEGLTVPQNQQKYGNLYNDGIYYPFHRPEDTQLDKDLPHEYPFVATQLAKSVNTGLRDMTGFVEAYAAFSGMEPNIHCDPMGFFASGQVPITSFLAQKFCTCDNWFCPLPTSTQPNRTVAFCGHSEIFETKTQAIPSDGNIFKWLTDRDITWAVYSDGLPFFILYPGLWLDILGPNFRHYERLATDLKNNTAPQVIIVEPSYQDAPHVPPDHPNDNHPPLAIGWGEEFLRRTYQAATINPDVWANTLMVVYYDEHGGFYDHVPPPSFDNLAAGNVQPPEGAFDTLGPRIPAVLISPWVKPGDVRKEQFDHTSVLQFLAERFAPDGVYSPQVSNRAGQGIGSISVALNNEPVKTPPPAPPPAPIFAHTLLGDNIASPPVSGMGQSLEKAALDFMKQHPNEVDEKFPLLNNWKAAVEQARPLPV